MVSRGSSVSLSPVETHSPVCRWQLRSFLDHQVVEMWLKAMKMFTCCVSSVIFDLNVTSDSVCHTLLEYFRPSESHMKMFDLIDSQLLNKSEPQLVYWTSECFVECRGCFRSFFKFLSSVLFLHRSLYLYCVVLSLLLSGYSWTLFCLEWNSSFIRNLSLPHVDTTGSQWTNSTSDSNIQSLFRFKLLYTNRWGC